MQQSPKLYSQYPQRQWQQPPIRGKLSKGRALDTIFTERLWRTVKYENMYLQDYQSPREARQGIRD
jgi:hypothetical protein